MALRPFQVVVRPFIRCLSPAAKPTVAGFSEVKNMHTGGLCKSLPSSRLACNTTVVHTVALEAESASHCCSLPNLCGTDTLQTSYKYRATPYYPAEGAILVPLALKAADTLSNNYTCSHGLLHLSSIEMVPLSSPGPTSTSQDGPPFLVIASTSALCCAAATHLCSHTDSPQLMSQQDRDYTAVTVQTAAAGAVDSIVDRLVDDALLCHNTAVACAVDAVVAQLVSKSICDAEAAVKQRQQAARAVVSVLDDLVSDAIAEDEAAQVEVGDTMLNKLISNAVGDFRAALAESLSDLDRQSTAVDEQVISSANAEAGAESAAACQSFTAQSHVREPTGDVSEAAGSLSKGPGMHSRSGVDQVVRSACYSEPQAAEGSGGAGGQQVQQLRRDMELLSTGIHLEVYRVPSLLV